MKAPIHTKYGNILEHENSNFSCMDEDRSRSRIVAMEKEDDKRPRVAMPKSTTKMRQEIVDAVVKEIKQKEQVCGIFYSLPDFFCAFSWFSLNRRSLDGVPWLSMGFCEGFPVSDQEEGRGSTSVPVGFGM